MALLDRALIVALVVSAALVSPSTADACSCGSFFEPTAAACATAKRVFAGSVTSYRWPTTLDYVLRSGDVEVELLVDRVWRGNVPAELVTTTGLGGGDCGISPLPGTRFLYCDDEEDAAPPSFGFCDLGSFGATSFETALGPSRPPVGILGRSGQESSSALVLGVGAVVLLGLFTRRRHLAGVVVCVASVLTLAYLRSGRHDAQPGAIRCSLERAQTIFASVPPDDEDTSRLAAAVARSPYACTDWGLARYVVESNCAGFPDGDGGQWWTCRGEHGFTTFLGWDRRH